MPQDSWMSQYQDRRLGEMHLPGSHDAGTTKNFIDLTVAGTNSNAATQSLSIADQISAGTRFFDLRLSTHKKQVVAHHTTAGQGAYSAVAVNDVLKDASTFCLNHPTEVVIFRISHTSGETGADAIAKRSGGAALHKSTGNLCDKTLGEIARDGNLVCIFDEKKFAIDQKSGIHAYSKFKSLSGNDRGIATCGCYSGTHKLEQVVCNGLKGQYEHNTKHGNVAHRHLWQVYWQKTYTNPLSTTGIERGARKEAWYRGRDDKVHGGTHAATGYMLNLMKGQGPVGREDYAVKEGSFFKRKPAVMYSTLPVRNYTLPNIFSYDFVNEATNKQIIAMNNKGLQAAVDDQA
jgi:hypothetical protein